jgi:hypothetical protein
VAEIGDISRFQNPKELMACLGLVPSEHSSGSTIRRGGITKTGNSHARRLCVESAWAYRYPARVTSLLLKRHEDVISGAKSSQNHRFKTGQIVTRRNFSIHGQHVESAMLFLGRRLRIWYPIDHLGSASLVLLLGLSKMPLLQESKKINRIAQKENLLGSTRHFHYCVSPQDEETRERPRKAFMDVVPYIRITK